MYVRRDVTMHPRHVSNMKLCICIHGLRIYLNSSKFCKLCVNYEQFRQIIKPCLCIHMHVYMHTCMNIHTWRLFTHAFMHASFHISIKTVVCRCDHKHAFARLLFKKCTCSGVVSAHAYIYIYIYICICIYVVHMPPRICAGVRTCLRECARFYENT
jgi:hypothetical protein